MTRPMPSIRMLVTLLVVLPIALVSALLIWLSTQTSARVAGELARKLVDSASARTVSEIRHYLEDAVRTSDRYHARLAQGELRVDDLDAWIPGLYRDIAGTPGIAAITFGRADGAAVMVMRNNGRLEVGKVAAGANDAYAEFPMAAGVMDPTPSRRGSYDPRLRPWYAAAVGATGPTWTPIYTWFVAARGEDSTIGTGYTRAVRDASGELLGVLLVDVTLGGLTDYLKLLPLEQTGRVLVIDDQRKLVASSVGGIVRDDGERFTLDESPTEAARSAALSLKTPVRSDPQTGEVELRRFRIDGQWKRAKVAVTAPHAGIHWQIITILPERLFMGGVERTRTRAMLTGLGATLGSLGLGLWLSRRLSRPIEQIGAHVKKIGAGDFDSRLELRGARELHDVSHELNRAAAGLKQRMELEQSLAVAMEVQKSLLPDGDPTTLDRLEVAGRSQYCDATGGDYYDFLAAKQLPRGQSLLVLGDVMGHGVAAALLMATARAALRAHVLDGAGEGDLARLLSRVNRVLAADNRHNRFMTLSLVVVDPDAGSCRWASAGHDPVWIYRPASGGEGQFTELDSPDIPLGLDAEWSYSEQARGDLRPGDVIVIGSDGVWELFNAAGDTFGKDRMREVVRQHAAAGAQAVARALDEAMVRFRGSVPIKDDVTFVVARVLEPSPQEAQ